MNSLQRARRQTLLGCLVAAVVVVVWGLFLYMLADLILR